MRSQHPVFNLKERHLAKEELLEMQGVVEDVLPDGRTAALRSRIDVLAYVDIDSLGHDFLGGGGDEPDSQQQGTEGYADWIL